jgi:hypothetical protein
MKVDASSAGDMPAFAGFRRSMGAFEQVFCTFLRPPPRNSLGSGRGVAVGFPPIELGFRNEESPERSILSELPSLRENMCPAVRTIKWIRK